jgi:hypothetical protein
LRRRCRGEPLSGCWRPARFRGREHVMRRAQALLSAALARSSARSLVLAVALTLPFGAGGVLAAGPPNDLLANATPVDVMGFEATPDMTGADLEAGEIACDETGGLMDGSIWYSWESTQPAVIGIQIDGPQFYVTAAVYGPFETLPTTIGELPDSTYCICGTGADAGLTEYYGIGQYLVQLTTVSSETVTPGIHISQSSPVNNDVAYPMAAPLPLFEASPDMAWTWLEENEPVCDESGGLMDQSVWYRVDVPDLAVLQIEINGELLGVTAGVYGPFDELPTSVDGLEATYCVYGTGQDSALTEAFAPGSYLVQLSTVSAWGVWPSIRIQEVAVVVRPWWTGNEDPIVVPDGVAVAVEWGWAACSRGLAMQAPAALAQASVLRTGQEKVASLSPEDAVGIWWMPDAWTPPEGYCRSQSGAGASRYFAWWAWPGGPGDYQLDVLVTSTRMLTDGGAAEVGGISRYPAGTVFFEGTVQITVPES